MKFFLFILISLLLPVSTQKTNALTQTEALEQVREMDEKEYVERSLKTILYLNNAGSEQETQKYSEQDNFLPLELYLGYDIQTLYDKFGNSTGTDFKEYYHELNNSIFSKGFMKRVRQNRKKYISQYEKQKNLCNKLLGYNFSSFSCQEDNLSHIYIYQKSITKTLYLKDDTAIVRLEYIENPKYFGHFTLKKENGIWKLDNVKCGGLKECQHPLPIF